MERDLVNRPIRRSDRYEMRLVAVLLAIFTRFFYVENRTISKNYNRDAVTGRESEPTLRYPIFNFAMATEPTAEDYENGKIINFKSTEKDIDNYDYNTRQFLQKLKEPCAIVVRSNIQNPTMQSLLRKYKYDARGVLIPSSVKYYMKVPQGYGTPILVPLNDKSFSHLGGFVRYYKEVPPIPQAW